MISSRTDGYGIGCAKRLAGKRLFCWEICGILPLLSIKGLLITVIYATALNHLAFAVAVKTMMNFSLHTAVKSPGYQKSIKSLSSLTSHLNICSLMGGSLVATVSISKRRFRF